MPELRQDPATQEWVIVATERARRLGEAGPMRGFLILLAVLAGGLGGATVLSYRNAVQTAEALLRGQAMDVALAVEAAARRADANTTTLQAVLEERRGGGVAYAGQLTLLFTNLLLNALQAMPGGGTVQVTIARQGDLVTVGVADEGPGIAPEDAPRLFQPFYTTKPKGTGLGLAICRGIAEAHGGRIVVEPDGGRGARLRVELPGADGVREAAATAIPTGGRPFDPSGDTRPSTLGKGVIL